MNLIVPVSDQTNKTGIQHYQNRERSYFTSHVRFSKISVMAWAAITVITAASCRKEVEAEEYSVSQTESVSATAASSSKIKLSRRETNYGAYICAPNDVDAYTFITNVATDLGISCLRDRAPVPGYKKVKLFSSRFHVLLNFMTTGNMPFAFRTDIAAYKADLENALAACSGVPLLGVIENEESNKKYFSGTPIQYINQLQAGIEVMHAHNICVTNGGITSVGLKYLVYQDYLSRGMIEEANDYKMRMKIAVKSPDTQDRAAFIKVLLEHYAVMDLDFVNFHWRSNSAGDVKALGETIDYLKRVTGKKIITNEIGQYDQDPETVTQTLQLCRDYKLPVVLWYSGEQGEVSYPLQNDDETLNESGLAFQNFIAP